MNSVWTKDFINWGFPSVESDLFTPILIIGGGIAGLMCAYELMLKKIDFILVDAKKLGRGVSASTTAQVSLAHDSLLYDIKEKHDEEKAKDYLREQIKGLTRLKTIIKKENINCDYQEESTILGSAEHKNIKILDDQFELSKKITPLKKIPIYHNILGFTEAVEFKNQAIINPVKYMNGIIRALYNKAIPLYENSQVTAINKMKNNYEVTINDQYKVHTQKIIMAAHYPFLLQNLYFIKLYQSSSYAISFKTKLKLNANYVSLDKPYYYLRTLDKNTLIIGGSDHFTGTSINIEECYEKLTAKILELDSKAEILNKWFTEDAMPLNYLPYVQPYSGTHPNIILVTGFQKWGFTNSHAAALKVRDLIMEKPYSLNSPAFFKNIKNYLRLAAHSVNGLLISKIFLKSDTLDSITIGSGMAMRYQGKNILVFRENEKEYYIFKNKCTHMGCSLIWNDVDKVWISKCHGTIYDRYGKVIYGPGIKDLEKLN